MQKFDLHCHAAEGSIDAFVKINEIAIRLKEKGYNGMLITDHNSYNAYKHIKNIDNFVILKGIEYDTIDCGHVIIILPNNIICKEFIKVGMTLEKVSNIVHKYNGVLGLAHPFDHGPFGCFRNKLNLKRIDEIVLKIDFIEVFNSSASEKGNLDALKIAQKYNLAITGGSDCHRKNCIGIGQSIINTDIKDNNDLIQAIKERKIVECFGTFTQKKFKRLKHFCFNCIIGPYYELNKLKVKLMRKN